MCLLGSLIAEYNPKQIDDEKNLALMFLYQICKFSSHFGLIFLMLITAELFPTSLRCTGVGLCLLLKSLGSLIAHPDLLNYNSITHRLFYCILTLLFGSMTLFLPETKSFPLPRSILQIEAMPTAIGKKLRSRKVQLACERRQNQYAETDADLSQKFIYDSDYKNLQAFENNKTINYIQYSNANQGTETELKPLKSISSKSPPIHSTGSKRSTNLLLSDTSYDTVTSVHDIEQDDHKYYNKESNFQTPKYTKFNKLGKINELPSHKTNLLKSYNESLINSKI